jgi:hypothetical protein
MKKVLLLLFVFIGIIVQAQFTNIMISNAHNPVEPAIIINPNNTDIQFAASNLANYYVSTDAGATWTAQVLTSSLGVWGDFSLAIDSSGNFYSFHLSNATSWIDRIVCQKSTDNGVTFNDGSHFGLNGGKAQDKEWIVLDSDDNIYALWTEFDVYGSGNTNDKSRILFSKSVDGAATWTTPVKVNEVDGNCVDSDLTVEGAVPTIGPNGEIYTVWAGPNGLSFDKSLDGGLTWLANDVIIDSMPGGWDYDISGIDRCNGLPITKCDLSEGAHHGTIYVNWSDQRNGENDTDVWLKKSTDGGDTWSDPIRVNDDGIGNQQFLTWMDIDQTNGNIYIVFYDRRNYTDDNTDVYLARSTDGGDTFQNILISESPFLPVDTIFFGDYTNISAYNGVIRPIWGRMHNGEKSIWTALINDNAIASKDDYFNVNFELSQNYPNPVENETYISFKLRNEENVTLSVYNFLGKEVLTVFKNKPYNYGKHIVKIALKDSKLASGVYFYKLKIGNNIKTKKMVIK